ncbi:efflux transporter outer membrane subunit [Roseiconus lacunae]|uniref:Efflux transporter outer membrane subunit n=1 Tax=Roseiconus lacunae TaxID=2605694 RepID=A0ABT7PP48_9BACT|nr:efflux transporter outer membrane subunit [Roseiconus lacunae]MDM4018071.1 efflux transporter outer membrane subunit [Roseiconus lacunae]WRQ50770.1 efflux transporter outer membrane subunit [Stieleria sp. HD01]
MNRFALVPQRNFRFVLAIALLLAGGCALLIIGGCAGRQATGTFSAEPPPSFSASGDVVQPDQWWNSFGDPQLDEQINQLFDGSFTLAAAIQRLSAARAVTRREASDFFIDLNGVSSIGSTYGPGSDDHSYLWGFDASYQVDLWGRIESQVEAERLRAAATHADYHAIALALTAEVTRTWFALIEAHAQLELLDEQIQTNQTGLSLQEARFGLGQIRSPDVLRQRQLVEGTLEQSAVVKSQIEVLEHRLAILLGQMPQNAKYSPGSNLPALPPLPNTGLPAELLKRRPDVRRDYLAFMAANKDLAAAISDQFPRLDLSGSLLNSAEKPEDLFRDWFLSIGGQLVGPILDGGQRRAEVDRNSAIVRQRFNEYGDTMLNAFAEVEDNLAREKYQLERLTHLEAQAKWAQMSADQLREQYLINEADYLDVLSAITAGQRLQRETLSARLDLLLIRVSLYLALAGGFEPRPQPTIVIQDETVVDGVSISTGEPIESDLPETLPPISNLNPAGPASAAASSDSLAPLIAPDNSGDFEQLLRTVDRLPDTELDE